MIAQTMVEYGGIQSGTSAFARAYSQVEHFLTSGDSRYLLFAVIAVFAVIFLTRRRAR